MSWYIDYDFDLRRQTYKIFMKQTAGKGMYHLVANIEFKEVPANEGQLLAEDDILELPTGEAEDFMRAMADCAWRMGIKPTAFNEDDSELTAVKYHLEDMRSLVFEKEEIKID